MEKTLLLKLHKKNKWNKIDVLILLFFILKYMLYKQLKEKGILL